MFKFLTSLFGKKQQWHFVEAKVMAFRVRPGRYQVVAFFPSRGRYERAMMRGSN